MVSAERDESGQQAELNIPVTSLRPQITLSGLLVLLTLTSLCFALLYVAQGWGVVLLVFCLPVTVRVLVSWSSQQLLGRRLTARQVLLLVVTSFAVLNVSIAACGVMFLFGLLAVRGISEAITGLALALEVATPIALLSGLFMGLYILWCFWNLPDLMAGVSRQRTRE